MGKTQFRGLCLLSRALGQLSKYEIEKGGHFILRQSFKLTFFLKNHGPGVGKPFMMVEGPELSKHLFHESRFRGR